MPIHDLQCLRCGEKFEFFKARSDDIAECPKCKASGDKNLTQLIPTGTSFSLQGRGWYKDGYGGRGRGSK